MKHIVATVIMQFSAIFFGTAVAQIYKIAPALAWQVGICGLLCVLCMGLAVGHGPINSWPR
jgi:hypothetical protein